MERNDEFLALYNEIDSLLQQKYGDYDRNRSMIMRYCQDLQHSSYSETYERGRLLNLVRQLRNSLIHDFDMNKDGLIYISDKTINLLKNEVAVLSHPTTAYDIATKVVPNLFPTDETNTVELLSKMTKKGFMQMPIVYKDGTLQGVFSPNVILRFIAENGKTLNHDSVIKDLSNYLPINKHISEFYEFVGRNEPATNISKLFEKYMNNGKKLVMVFVTENAKQNEKIIGIITAYDIVRFNSNH